MKFGFGQVDSGIPAPTHLDALGPRDWEIIGLDRRTSRLGSSGFRIPEFGILDNLDLDLLHPDL